MKFITAVSVVTITVLLLKQVHAPPPVGRGYVYIVAEIDPRTSTRTGFYKVGATGNANPDVTRSSLNTGNPRRLEVILFNPVSATREAKATVLEAIAQWSVQFGGGREWYHVPPAQWNVFIDTFEANIEP